jgi:hypothetical protein
MCPSPEYCSIVTYCTARGGRTSSTAQNGVLPQPEGPTMATLWPGSMLIETLRKTGFLPNSGKYFLELKLSVELCCLSHFHIPRFPVQC